MEIRRLGRDDAALLRDVRLRALRDAPYAFSSWLAREAELPGAFWRERVAESEAGETGVIYVAFDGGRCVAMAGGFVADQQRGDAMLWGTWVESSARRHGVGRRLVEAVAGWARDVGARRLKLAVAQDEASRPAAALYQALGFEDTGESEPLQSDPSSVARVMARALGERVQVVICADEHGRRGR